MTHGRPVRLALAPVLEAIYDALKALRGPQPPASDTAIGGLDRQASAAYVLIEAAVTAAQVPDAPPAERYRHYKGGLYTRFGTVTHSETEEELVLYRSEQNGRLFVRPAAMWGELVDGVPRFARVEDDHA